MTQRAERWTGEARAAAAMITCISALELYFALNDARLPHDSNAALLQVPSIALALSHADLLGALAPLLRPGGWQELALAVLAVVTGASPLVFHLWFTGWFLFAAGCVARAAGALRPGAAVPALGLFFGIPLVTEQARIGWLHLPELALCCAAAAELLSAEGPLDRARLGRVAVIAALLGSLRGSGLAWAAATVVAALPSLGPSRRERAVGIAVLGVGLGVGLLVTGPDIAAYASEKVAMSTRYGFLGGAAAWTELAYSLGPFHAWIVAVSIGAAIPAWPEHRRLALAFLGGLGLLVPMTSMFLLSSPITNAPVFLGAAAIIGGVGLAGWGRWGAAVALLGWMPLVPLQLLPTTWFQGAGFPAMFQRYIREDRLNYQRVYPYPAPPQVLAHLEACREAHPRCTIVAESGLFHPTPEEPGNLELFYLGYPAGTFNLVPLADGSHLADVDVLVRFNCVTSYANWQRRHPDYAQVAAEVVERQGLTEQDTVTMGPGCTLTWNERPSASLPSAPSPSPIR